MSHFLGRCEENVFAVRCPIRALLRGIVRHTEDNGALGRNRTCDQEIRKLLLYPLSYEGQSRFNDTAGATGCTGWLPRN